MCSRMQEKAATIQSKNKRSGFTEFS